ncbi:hypothetical protein CDD83_11086 [Cordyceps sp. RAO-2017]|nr:hypothetical protein CDD83_11086 [Cordyceps sp. RAO-2017]
MSRAVAVAAKDGFIRSVRILLEGAPWIRIENMKARLSGCANRPGPTRRRGERPGQGIRSRARQAARRRYISLQKIKRHVDPVGTQAEASQAASWAGAAQSNTSSTFIRAATGDDAICVGDMTRGPHPSQGGHAGDD